jgi:hypothetical protein
MAGPCLHKNVGQARRHNHSNWRRPLERVVDQVKIEVAELILKSAAGGERDPTRLRTVNDLGKEVGCSPFPGCILTSLDTEQLRRSCPSTSSRGSSKTNVFVVSPSRKQRDIFLIDLCICRNEDQLKPVPRSCF